MHFVIRATHQSSLLLQRRGNGLGSSSVRVVSETYTKYSSSLLLFNHHHNNYDTVQRQRLIHMNATMYNEDNKNNNNNNKNNNDMYHLYSTTSRINTATAKDRGDVDEQQQPPLSVPIIITLYQYQICPFCNRVKALLDYTKIPYNIIEVNPLTKHEIQSYSKIHKKVPIATITTDTAKMTTDTTSSTTSSTTNNNTKVLFGSDDILDSLLENDYVQKQIQKRRQQHLNEDDILNHPFLGTNVDENNNNNDNNNGSSGNSNNHGTKSRWSKYASEELATLLYPNICRTLSDSYEAFQYVRSIPTFTTTQQISIHYLGALAMYFAASKVKKKYHITDERQALVNAIKLFEQDGLQNGTKQYLSGTMEPNLDDLQVYGVLRSIEGLTTHTEMILKQQTNDNQSSDTTLTSSSSIMANWYKNMKMKVEESK